MENHDTDELELIILGAGPAYSNVPGSLGSAYLLRSAEASIVLDLGQGTFPSLASRVEPSEVAGVLISHLHPDHFIDLIPLRHYLKRAEATGERKLPVHAANGLEERIDGTWGSAGFSAAAFDHVELQPGSFDVGPFRVDAVRVEHSGHSFAFRVAPKAPGARGVVYTGDIGVIADAEPLVHPGDAILSEATYGPGPVPDGMPHIDARAAAEMATRTDASQLVLTHVRMGIDLKATMSAAAIFFAGPTSLARPDARFFI
jgi:ribonuclease BN (tRNA processing enzyme)